MPGKLSESNFGKVILYPPIQKERKVDALCTHLPLI